MQFLCNPGNISPRVKYTVNFIFSTLGFNVELISITKLKKSKELVIGYLSNEELQSFKNINLINIANFNELNHLEEFEKSIKIKKVNSENIPILGRTFNEKKGIGWKKSKKENYYFSDNKTWQLEYDIISNIFYHLSRFEERWRIFADEKDADWTKSVLSRADNLRIPVVDVLINEFKSIIYSKCKQNDLPVVRILPWPNAEKFGVAFTHDVDLTRGYSAKEYLISKSKSVLYFILNRSDKKEKIDKKFEDKNSAVWSFTQIQDFYKKKKWKATFFFIAKMLEGRHLRYDVSSKKFQRLFKELKSEGHEIALHPSLNAFKNPEKYKSEKKHLEKNAESEIQGMRQHYLRFKAPRIWNLTEMAKLKYDSSLGYNFQSGFRAGTSKYFKAFDYKDNQALNVLEFPIAYFEYNLPQQGQNEKQSNEVIKSLVKQVEKNEGLLNVLIHPSNFLVTPFKEYWQLLIELIEKKKIFVATLSEFYEWDKNKRQIKLAIKMIENKMIIEVKKPRSLKAFSLELSQNGEFEQTEIAKIKKAGTRKYLCKSVKSNFSLTYNLN
jgi:peptidoglycan/xylan/chitin deacetylase (PgdA/CDA1 family)